MFSREGCYRSIKFCPTDVHNWYCFDYQYNEAHRIVQAYARRQVMMAGFQPAVVQATTFQEGRPSRFRK